MIHEQTITLGSLFLGTLSIEEWIFTMILALIGAVISLRISARDRDVLSSNTPKKFSWVFLIWDNITDLFFGFLLAYITFRFTPEITKAVVGAEVQFSYPFGLFFGFLYDALLKKLESFREKAREKFKE